MFKKAKINILFPSLTQGEDSAFFTLNNYYNDLKISFYEEPLYYYRYNTASITKIKSFSLEKFLSSTKALFAYMCLYKDYQALNDSKSLYRLYDAYLKLKKYKEDSFANSIQSFFEDNYKAIVKNKDVDKDIKRKIYLICKLELVLYPRYFRDRLNYYLEKKWPLLYVALKNK